jgi:hypothetical protein
MAPTINGKCKGRGRKGERPWTEQKTARQKVKCEESSCEKCSNFLSS